MNVRIVSQYNEFLKLKEPWNHLLKNSLHSFVFLSHQWINTWWKAFGEGKQLFILLVYDQDELMAIAPFMISHGPHPLIGKTNTTVNVKKIEFIANVHSNRADLILGKKPEEACEAIIDDLTSNLKKSWDLLSLEYLLGNSPSINYLRSSLENHNISFRTYFQMSTPYVPVTSCWNDFFNNLQPRFKRNLKSRLKSLEEAGRVSLEVYVNAEDLGYVLKRVFDVASKSWKAKEGTALSSTSQLKEFYTDLAYTAAKEGWLELFIVYLEEDPIAFDYCLKYENKLYDLKTEFDDNYSAYGVGNMLKWMEFKSIFESGYVEFDFLGPSMPWKTFWSKENEREHIRFYAFNKSYKGRGLNFAYNLKDAVRKVLGKLAVR